MTNELQIPTEKDWKSETWSEDTKHSYKCFVGRDLFQASRIFVSNTLGAIEDLIFMPKKCFKFYIRSLIIYLHSPEAKWDSSAANGFISLIESRGEIINKQDIEVKNEIASMLQHLKEHHTWYDYEPSVYGDLSKRLLFCKQKIGFKYFE